MIKIAIDQSSQTAGFAIGNLAPGSRKSDVLEFGVFTPDKGDVLNRIISHYTDMDALIREYNPDLIILEQWHVFSMHRRAVIEALVGASTMFKFAARNHGVRFTEMQVSEWRPAVGAKGKTSEQLKADTRRIVCLHWDIPETAIKSYDTSDALGILAAHDAIYGDQM